TSTRSGRRSTGVRSRATGAKGPQSSSPRSSVADTPRGSARQTPRRTMSVDALVTGGSGFIGSALVGALPRAGPEGRVADLQPFRGPDVPEVVGDLLDADVRAAALDGGPTTVYHLAARTSVLQSKKDPLGVYRVNVEMTQHLLEDARRAGSRSFVLASTNAVA